MPLFEPEMPEVDINAVPGFRYRGGKYKLRRWICRWCPLSGSSFVEPFAGRGNVFFLMRMIADFERWHLNDIRMIPFFESILNYDGSPIVWPSERVFRHRVNRGDTSQLFMEPALMWDGGTAITVKGRKTTFAAKFKQYNPDLYRRLILKAQTLLGGVELTAKDANHVMWEYSHDPNAFLYVDPPYLKANVDAYDDGMVDREEMIRALRHSRARWLLSEYYCEDLVEAFGEPFTKIRKVKIIVPGKGEGVKGVAGGKRKVRTLTECLWANYEMRNPQPINFGYTDGPTQNSLRLLASMPGKVSLRKWLKSVPDGWDPEFAVEEYEKLTRNPYCYFDGKFLWRVGSDN